jgi:hypothetical protein
MSCSRWIAVCTDMLDHPVVGMHSPERMAAWLWLISRAAWKPERFNHKGKPVTLQRGQVLIGRAYLAKEWKWSEQSVRTFLALLVKEGMLEISNQSNGHFANVATVCNYEKFQTATIRDGQSINQSPTRAQPEPNQTSTKVTNLTSSEEVNNYGQSNHAAREPAADRPTEPCELKTAFNGATAAMVADVAKWMGLRPDAPEPQNWLRNTLTACGQAATATAYAMLLEKKAGGEIITRPLTWWGTTAATLKRKAPAPEAKAGIRVSPGTVRFAKPAPEVGHA